MINIKDRINEKEEIVVKRVASNQLRYFNFDSSKSKRKVQIRDEIFGEIIKLINNKKYYMLGPEKGVSARFIAENYKELFQILLKKIQDDLMS